MKTESIKAEILKDITPLWLKESNTVYALRVVLPQFDNPVGIFFEWNKIGRATHSQPIASYPAEQAEQVVLAVEEMKTEHGLTVVISE